MPRIFVAIDFPKTVQEKINELPTTLPCINWYPRKQLHLTLCFMGEITHKVLDAICYSLSEIKWQPFSLSLEGLGSFPSYHAPKKVLWLSSKKNEQLNHLQNKIAKIYLHHQTDANNKEFFPHVTIGKVKKCKIEKVEKYIKENNSFNIQKIKISQFYIYESFLSNKGATHKKIATF